MDHLNRPHILISGGGAPGAAGIIQALRGTYKISSCDQFNQVVGRELADEFFRVPHGKHKDYLSDLKKEVIDRSIDLVLPITTAELLPLSSQKAAWNKEGIKILVSDKDSLDIANDKGKLYEHLAEKGIALPNYRIVHNLKSFDRALDDLGLENKALVFKPCVANGSRGFRIINGDINPYDLWLNHKPNNLHISRQQSLEVLAQGPFVPLLVSDYLEGDEYSIDCMVHEGIAELIIPRKRIKINNGISVEGVIEKNEELIAYCQEIIATLNLEGPIGIQVKYSQNKPYLLEINPRLQGSSTAAIGAGINLPLIAVKVALGQSIDWEGQRKKIKWGTHFYRVYQEVFGQ